ncbi:Lig chan domain containing protein [Asbolus verrucosus]|uniref:Lig chan domain containing protein n=1 Tax=Asbolus verrucosus TaxID=1661398 RepID=A0A482WD41_ASBVE|nr:Lig chan domain containing protein [Asbolus verrucosus]
MVSLLLNTQSPTFHTVQELAESRYEVGVDDQDYTRNWFYTSNFTDVQNLYKNKLRLGYKNLTSCPPEGGIGKIEEDNFAYHVDTDTAYDTIGKIFKQEIICELSEIQMIPSGFAGFEVQKESQFLKSFQISLHRLRQVGLIQRAQMTWVIKKPECYTNSELASVGLEQALPAFLWLPGGMLLAFLVLLLESLRNLNKN